MSVTVSYKSNLSKFLSQYSGDKSNALDRLGEVGVEAIKAEAPVDTGNLRDSTRYETTPESVVFVNDATKDGVIYPAYVELGTYKTAANPFMRRGLVKSEGAFIRILTDELKV